MGLNAALKDRARIIALSPLPVKVEGRTQMVETQGPWFKVRLQLPQAMESGDPGNTRRTVVAPTLLIGTRDADGGSTIAVGGGCVISAKHKLRVLSAELGDSVWEVVGKPAPIRKKKRLLGWELPIKQVDDEPFEARFA